MTMTSVNHGEPYFLKADISKAGQSSASINDYIKMRVADNGKILPVQWYDQGRVMNVNGMIPFMEGAVGQWHTDDDNNIVMAPDADYRDWQGSAANTRDGGWADYILTDQMFTQKGIFYGKIGLMDGNGRRLTSIDIWFRVLGDDVMFGLTQKYYSDRVEKLIRQIQDEADANFKFLQQKYDQEVAEHSNALTSSTAELNKLAVTAGSIRSEITAKNFVEYADFVKSNDSIRNAIDDRLQHISLVPETFASLDDLKAKYPDGKDGLFKVGNTGYIWGNNQWTSSGELSSTVISDADFNQRVGSFMFFKAPNDHVEIHESLKDGEYGGVMDIPSGVLIYLADEGKYKGISTTKIGFGYTQNDVEQKGLATLYFDNNSKLYFAFSPARRNDLKIFSIYQGKVYGGINIDSVYFNGIAKGGWDNSSVYGYAMYMPQYQHDNHIDIEFDQSTWHYKVSYGNINIIETQNGMHYLSNAGAVEAKGTSSSTLNLYLSLDNNQLYLDTKGHASNDVMIATLFGAHAYGQNVKGIVVNGIADGGFGEVYKPYTLTDWRIDAYKGNEVNIAWLGDSTFEGFKVKDANNVAANYINQLLINDFPKVRSYNCSKGGWTTRQLADNFDNLTKDVPNMRLVLIGGGINDRENIADSRKALDEIVTKVQRKQMVPIICTTQASALLYANISEGGDWTLEQDWYAKINEMRRIYAKEHNVMLIDLEKYDTKFIEYGPNKLSEMFDDQMHGHDPIHKFEAQLVMSYLAKDHVDIIEEDTPVTVTTMKARSDSTYNLTSQELDNSILNAKGFKAHMSRQNVNQDLTILDYQFFIPAGYKKYYLNGYNLGNPVSITVNNEKINLSASSQVEELRPGYYHVIVKPTTDKFDFVGLRIESEKINEN